MLGCGKGSARSSASPSRRLPDSADSNQTGGALGERKSVIRPRQGRQAVEAAGVAGPNWKIFMNSTLGLVLYGGNIRWIAAGLGA